MNAEIIIIGDEILLGLLEDRNSFFLSRRLSSTGVRVSRIHTLGDDLDTLAATLDEACRRADLVITSGGLGPTHDDRTRFAIAHCLGVPLEMNESALEDIKRLYERANRPMTETNRIQAMLPRGADYLSNPEGTAPGIHCHLHKADLYALPGIPREMQTLFELYIVPWLSQKGFQPRRFFCTIRTTNVPESLLYEKTRDLIEAYRSVLSVAFLPKTTRGVDIRLTLSNAKDSEDLLEEPLQKWIQRLNAEFDNPVFGFDEDTMEMTVAELFFRTGQTVATAESCTAGMLADRLTRISGSSRFFLNGVITYSNASKTQWLGVPEEVLQRYGAVSEETAKHMAEAIRIKSETDIGISITGIAGPTGGTPDKPVGTVFIGLADENHLRVHQPFRTLVTLDRLTFKERTTQFALDVLRKYLLSCLRST